MAKMNEFFKNIGKKTPKYLKIGGIVIAAIVLLAIIYRIVEPVFEPAFDQIARRVKTETLSQSYDRDYNYYDYEDEGSIAPGRAEILVSGISSPSIEPVPPEDNVITGDDAEDFEVTEYNATVETTNLEETCAKVTDLKGLDYVIFENSNEYDQGCNYTFKVKNENADEILAKVKELDPKDFSEYTYTIKKRVENISNEVEILKKKRESIEATLAEAIEAYDDITALATKTQDVESLTKIIDSKIQIIERLTQEKININERLDRLAKSQAEQLDRLDYTYFNVNIFELKYIDGEELKDSWKTAVKEFVRSVNELAQDISINLVFLLLLAFQYGLYLFILLIFVKYGWKLGKYIWKK